VRVFGRAGCTSPIAPAAWPDTSNAIQVTGSLSRVAAVGRQLAGYRVARTIM
jgi:hypothetical protein